MPPSLPAALGLALRALWREAWLVPVGAIVAGARRAVGWPALAVAWAVAARAFVGALDRAPLDPAAPWRAALGALAAPRALLLVAGLWLAGALLSAALRVAWIAGAAPTLAGALSGPPGPRFARGVAFGFPAVLAASALALAADAAAALFSAGMVLAAARVTLHAAGGGGAPLAAVVALALALAVLVPLAAGAISDAAVARAALRLEGPGRAFAAVVRRFLLRPGTFVLAALAAGAAGLALGAADAGGLSGGLLGEAPAIVRLGPALLLGAVALALAAALDLVWLATASALACAHDAGGRR